ncbi:hypothetical protein JMJ58_14870 [Haloterrigena salifodinae]|uniref:Uncharacterized protein n=1 Tax=Haloterrigena salifodinae TaxID=2675099 RepID=A0A8T8DYG8_9EURY|nr:hypothetical protein [Haloterrigena salifodinae]QRV14216.1 hypothetical protein JMJ58_14870 [Haloterrigena salifodinae]
MTTDTLSGTIQVDSNALAEQLDAAVAEAPSLEEIPLNFRDRLHKAVRVGEIQ